MALTIQQQLELRHVEAYDLATFLQGVEQAIKDGYKISLEHNETYPYGSFGHYIVKMVKEEFSIDKLTLNVKVDTTEVQKVITDALEGLKTLQEASESTEEGASTTEGTKEVVEAPKRAETAAQDVKAKPGRKAKSE